MANDVSQPYVLVLDTTADNIVAVGTPVKIRKARLVAAAAAAIAVINKAGGSVGVIRLAAPVGDADEVDFQTAPFTLDGLEVTLTGAGAVLYIYTEQA